MTLNRSVRGSMKSSGVGLPGPVPTHVPAQASGRDVAVDDGEGVPSEASSSEKCRTRNVPAAVFSLAAVLVYAATGRGPFASPNDEFSPAVLLYRIVHQEPNLDGVPAALVPLLRSCLAKDPEQRATLGTVSALLERMGGRCGTWPQLLPEGWRELAVREEEAQALISATVQPPSVAAVSREPEDGPASADAKTAVLPPVGAVRRWISGRTGRAVAGTMAVALIVTRYTRFPGTHLLRRQIAGRTDHTAGPSVTRVIHRARDPEIDEQRTTAAQQHIGRLDIPMGQPRPVYRCQGPEKLGRECQDALLGQPAVPPHPLRQGRRCHVLGGEPLRALPRRAVVHHRRCPGRAHPVAVTDFPREPLLEPRPPSELGAHRLERRRTPRHRPGQIHPPHSTLTEPRQQWITTESFRIRPVQQLHAPPPSQICRSGSAPDQHNQAPHPRQRHQASPVTPAIHHSQPQRPAAREPVTGREVTWAVGRVVPWPCSRFAGCVPVVASGWGGVSAASRSSRGRSREGFGAPAGRVVFQRMRRKSRRTRAGASPPGNLAFSPA